MFALLQIYPPEALDSDDCGVEVLSVGDEEQLERFAVDYEERYRTAYQEWASWDDTDREWDEEHDRKTVELQRKYGVSAPSIGDMRWEIVEVGTPALEPDEAAKSAA